MTHRDDGLHKAAILLATLPTQTVDRLLDQFEPDQAQRLRNIVFELGEIDPGDQQRVLQEFLNRGSPLPDLLGSAGRQKGRAPDAYQPRHDLPSQPFQGLKEAEADRLARVLEAERPQAVALVLGHLPPEQAAAVLARFNAALQVDILRRLAELEETDPLVLAEVERVLQSRLSEQVFMQRQRVAGIHAVTGILSAAPRGLSQTIYRNLVASDPGFAGRLRGTPLEFDDLAAAGSEVWTILAREAEPGLLALALLGAGPDVIQKALAALPDPQATALARQLDNPGPTRLSDVEEARQQLAELAGRLTAEGALRPAARRRAVADEYVGSLP